MNTATRGEAASETDVYRVGIFEAWDTLRSLEGRALCDGCWPVPEGEGQ